MSLGKKCSWYPRHATAQSYLSSDGAQGSHPTRRKGSGSHPGSSGRGWHTSCAAGRHAAPPLWLHPAGQLFHPSSLQAAVAASQRCTLPATPVCSCFAENIFMEISISEGDRSVGKLSPDTTVLQLTINRQLNTHSLQDPAALKQALC